MWAPAGGLDREEQGTALDLLSAAGVRAEVDPGPAVTGRWRAGRELRFRSLAAPAAVGGTPQPPGPHAQCGQRDRNRERDEPAAALGRHRWLTSQRPHQTVDVLVPGLVVQHHRLPLG